MTDDRIREISKIFVKLTTKAEIMALCQTQGVHGYRLGPSNTAASKPVMFQIQTYPIIPYIHTN